ncbi:MAG: amino acid adenylation domain-containing protein [Bacteroidales bacterium]|jgi:amino acid adenylation domain-containing protein|nr:amino acid adenylation domain-containing protein [Bacteroidales bacterium]
MKINIIEYFIETVLNNKNKTAVIDGERSITFEELDKYSRKLAALIIQKKDIKNLPVAVYLPKSIESVCANMAITYSGNIYMNLDIKTPAERIKNILELISPAILITNSNLIKNIELIIPQNVIVINIDEDIQDGGTYEQEYLIKRISNLIDTDPYCIINTSGSTGTPKGVALNHKSFFDFIEWSVDTLHIGNEEVIGSLSPLVFDIYSHELCMMMAKSSTIVIIPDSLSAFPAAILNLMQKHNGTYIFWVPTIMVNIANMDLLSKVSLPSLKKIWFAGEVFPTKQFNYWRKSLPDCMFVNLYGPIEITLDCTYYIVEREISDDEPIPIGYPCRNTDIIILNEKNKKVSDGEEGELCVRGTSLALGYYNNWEKTNAAFVQNPLNSAYPEIIYRTGDIVFTNNLGEIVFKGRKDSLIKHLGYRIELGEIEHVVVNQLKLVKNCCVVYNYKKKEITLIYETPEPMDVSDMRKKLSAVFAKYMIPTGFIHMLELPRNTNGKIDRLLLSKNINE